MAGKPIPGVLPRRNPEGDQLPVDGRRHLCVYAPPRLGKTTLLRGLVDCLPRGSDWVVIDTAQRGDWNGWAPASSDPDAVGDPAAFPHLIWTPDLDAVRHPAADQSDPWSRGWWYLWNVRGELDRETQRPIAGSTVVVDEPTDGVDSHPIDLIHKATVQGEGRRLPIWWGSQNVLSVYWRLRGNTMQRFVAPLGTAQERGILAADWGVEIPVHSPAEPPEWGQFYYHAPGRALDGPWTIPELLPAKAARRTLAVAEAQRRAGT